MGASAGAGWSTAFGLSIDPKACSLSPSLPPLSFSISPGARRLVALDRGVEGGGGQVLGLADEALELLALGRDVPDLHRPHQLPPRARRK